MPAAAATRAVATSAVSTNEIGDRGVSGRLDVSEICSMVIDPITDVIRRNINTRSSLRDRHVWARAVRGTARERHLMQLHMRFGAARDRARDRVEENLREAMQRPLVHFVE